MDDSTNYSPYGDCLFRRDAESRSAPIAHNFGPGASRAEHLAWVKARALEYLPSDPEQAFASFCSDMNKHPETAGHMAIQLGMLQLMGGFLGTDREMRRFIEGTN